MNPISDRIRIAANYLSEIPEEVVNKPESLAAYPFGRSLDEVVAGMHTWADAIRKATGQLQPAYFVVEDYFPPVWGLHNPANKWNGWARSVFPRESVDVIVDAFTNTEWEGDMVRYGDDDECYYIEPITIAGQKLWDFGDAGWIFSVERPEREIADRMRERLQADLPYHRWAEAKEKGHAHDVCDQNVYLDEAFTHVMGRELDAQNDRDVDLANRAQDCLYTILKNIL